MAYDRQEAAMAADSDSASGEDTPAALSDLIETARGSEEGLRRAADSLDDQAAANRLRELANQRETMADELVELGSVLGAEATLSLGERASRAWTAVEISAAMSDDDVLDAVEESEDRAVDVYRRAVSVDLPPQAMAVVRRQLAEVETAHRAVRTMYHGL